VLGGDNRREVVDRWVAVKNGLTGFIYEPDGLPDETNRGLEAVNETGQAVNGSGSIEAPENAFNEPAFQPQGFVARLSGKRPSPMVTVGVIVGLSIAIMVLLLVGLTVAKEVESLLS